MTDREMLELAAKAASINLEWHLGSPVEVFPVWSGNPCEPPESDYRNWNPLTDDGDALRLAVKCKLMIDTADFGMATAYWRSGHLQDECYRRAIVRAAAEIGRAMP